MQVLRAGGCGLLSLVQGWWLVREKIHLLHPRRPSKPQWITAQLLHVGKLTVWDRWAEGRLGGVDLGVDHGQKLQHLEFWACAAASRAYSCK